MRVSVVRGGGLAGVTTRTTLDSEQLDEAGRAALLAKVATAEPFAQPTAAPSAARGPDAFSYQLTVEDGERTHTLQRSDTDLTPQLRDLLRLVMSAPERQREVLRPG